MKLEAWLGAVLGLGPDRSELVRLRVVGSLQELGQTKRKRVLLFLHKFLAEHQSVPLLQRTTLLKSITSILKGNTGHLSRSLSKKIISMASVEMSKLTGINDSHRETASKLLLTLGSNFPTEVFTELQPLMERRTQANFYVILTLANLCSENVFSVVPLLKPVLGTLFSLMHQEVCRRMQWVMCYALGHFSKSILTYASVPPPPTRKNPCASELSSAFDVLFHSWSNSSDPKMVAWAVEAMGQVIYLLPSLKVENELPTLIPTILSLFQKTHSDLSITKGLGGILHSAQDRNSKLLLPHLDNLLTTLHRQICLAMDQPSSPGSEDLQNKILGCFQILTPAHAQEIMKFLLLQLEASNEHVQLGGLAVVNHLINAVPSTMDRYKHQVMNCMAQPVLRCSKRVKGFLSQVIYTLASHNYLALQGGGELIRFLVEQCALAPGGGEEGGGPTEERGGAVTDGELRRLYERLLERLAKAQVIDDLLWPRLLELVTPARCTGALAAVCGALAHLGWKKQQGGETEFVLNYEEHAQLPSPQTLLARLLVVSSSPLEGEGRGAPALALLRVLGLNIHPAAVKLWDRELPPLVDRLRGGPELVVQGRWERRLLQLLAQTLEAIEEEAWIVRLAEEMARQGRSSPQQKGFASKCLGVVLQHTQSQQVVRAKLQAMLRAVRHDQDLEREGLATGIGYCAQTHLDIVLTVLKAYSRLGVFRKTATFYQIMKDQKSIEIIHEKSTLILCYGYLVLHCPQDKIVARIERDILPNVLNHFNPKIWGMRVQVTDSSLQLSLIQTISLLARAFTGKGQPAGGLPRKTELLALLEGFVRAEGAGAAAAIRASGRLLAAEPASALREHGELVRLCLARTFSAGEEISSEALLPLDDLLKRLLSLELSPTGLQWVFGALVPWMESSKMHHRETSLMATLHLLEFYLDAADFSQQAAGFVALIGYMVARCTDPSRVARELAVQCVCTLLCLLEGSPADRDHREVERLMGGLREAARGALYRGCVDLGNVLAARVSPRRVTALLLAVSAGLTDERLNGSWAASVVTHVLVRKRGAALSEVPRVAEFLCRQLDSVTQPRVARLLLHSISALASQRTLQVLPHLLRRQPPLHMDAVWRSLLRDDALARTTIKYLLGCLQLMSDGHSQDLQPVLRALRTMICSPGSKSATHPLYPQLFSVILLHLSSRVQICPRESLTTPQPLAAGGDAVEILHALLRRGEGSHVAGREVWDLIRSPASHHEGFMLLAGGVGAPHLVGVVEQLLPFLAHRQEGQRAAVVACFAQIVHHPMVLDLSLADTLVGTLLRCLIDPSPTVQRLAVRGLGNAANGAAQNIGKYSTKLLSALIAVIHKYWKSNHLLAVEALSSISKVLDSLQEHFGDCILIDVALAIQPLLENEHESMRVPAFQVLGRLVRFGRTQGNRALREHLRPALVTSLLQLNEHTGEVAKVCESLLILLGSGDAGQRLQELGPEGGALGDEARLSRVSDRLSEDSAGSLADHIISCAAFFGSPRPEMRANAVSLAGLLMGHGAARFALHPTADSVCGQIRALLSDPVKTVRLQAAATIRHLYMY
ncbi:maestro heat-like repeat-containing protein family member 1 [Narcine bancroftii]|uniref:maestro heat-like repeat-containing protein family member 1 n=1 Tax=Narcine bancroftii TaxID=1343680 RepID=UPI0038322B81